MASVPARSSYQYRPLRGPNNIRLLYPLYHATSDQLSFMMLEADLSRVQDLPKGTDDADSDDPWDDDFHSYIALSYTWGSPEPCRHVLLNGKSKPVTPNLYNALHTLTNSDPGRGIWADAICINQEDSTEKTHQIAMMRAIYRKALHTWVWLGPAWPGLPDAVKSMTIFSNAATLSEAMGVSDREERAAFMRKLEQAIDKDSASAFNTLVDRFNWFERAWIVQEVVLGKAVVMNCGDHQWPWDLFHRACTGFMVSRQATSDLMMKRNTILFQIGTFRSSLSTTQSTTDLNGMLLDILFEFQSCQATDARDKVFAFSALAWDGSHPELKPDYGKQFQQVFRDVSAHYLAHVDDTYNDGRLMSSASHHTAFIRDGPASHYFDLRLLHRAGGMENILAGIPSWAVDWRSPSRYHFQSRAGIKIFCAAGNLHKIVKQMPCNPDVMQIAGLRVATIAETSQPLHSRDGLRDVDFDEFNRLLGRNGEWEALANIVSLGGKYVPTGEYMDTVVRDTMVFDTHLWKGRLPPELQSYFWLYRTGNLDGRLAEGNDSGSLPMDENTTIELVNQKRGFGLNRRLAVTNNGLVGLVPSTAKCGDKICILFGAEMPFVLRPEGDHFRLVGDSYIHGIMDGEALIKAVGHQPPKFTHTEEDSMDTVMQDILRYRQVFVEHSSTLLETDVTKLNIPYQLFSLY